MRAGRAVDRVRNTRAYLPAGRAHWEGLPGRLGSTEKALAELKGYVETAVPLSAAAVTTPPVPGALTESEAKVAKMLNIKPERWHQPARS